MSYFDASLAGDLRVRFDALVRDWADVERKTMFGCPAYRVDAEVFAVVVTEGIVLTRLSAPERERLDAAFETRPFYANGRLVSGWVVVPDPDLEELRPYVVASYEGAAGS